MTEVRTVDREQLRQIVEAFETLSWPAPGSEMTRIGVDLGWTVDFERRNGINFVSDYSIDTPRVSVMFTEGDIGQASIDVSDRFRDADAEQAKALAASARRLRDEVASFLGQPARARTGKDARYTWDLANGGRVAVALLSRVVQVIVLQKRYADLERREEGLGISDDRDPSADQE